MPAENAPSVIESAGVSVREAPTHRARTFTATPGPVSGTATLRTASVDRRASYKWQYSFGTARSRAGIGASRSRS